MSQKNINKPPQSYWSSGVASSEHTSPSIHSEEHNNSSDIINSEKLTSKNDGLLNCI